MKASILAKLDTLAERYEEVGALMSDPDIIGDQNTFRELSKEYAELEPVVKSYSQFQSVVSNIEEAKALAKDADPDMRAMAQDELKEGEKQLELLELELQRLLLPKDPNDHKNVFLEIRAGTGGDEAAIFSGDLFRMYSKFAETQRWKVEVMSESSGDHGGYKEIIARIVGTGVYSQLKFESGAHRVQRVPDTESQGRIHTSACTVAIMPEISEVEAIDINTADLRIDTYRASGAGGQHVNRTDSAVRIMHEPSGIIVQCQGDRSQHKNKNQAMKQLKSKLYELEIKKRNYEKQTIEKSKLDIGWGSQIRSYVLDQSRIKDLRTLVEKTNTQEILNGNLDEFIKASLKMGL